MATLNEDLMLYEEEFTNAENLKNAAIAGFKIVSEYVGYASVMLTLVVLAEGGVSVLRSLGMSVNNGHAAVLLKKLDVENWYSNLDTQSRKNVTALFKYVRKIFL